MNVPTSQALRPTSPVAVSKVDHTGITVSSLDEALSFWVGALGFEHLYTWDFENSPFLEDLVGVKAAAFRLAMVEGPGHQIELLEYRSPDDRQVLRPRPCDVGSAHLAFYVEDIDVVLARIAPMDWSPLGRVQTIEAGERAGLRLVYVRGPDGMTLEFLQRPQGAWTADR